LVEVERVYLPSDREDRCGSRVVHSPQPALLLFRWLFEFLARCSD